LKKQQGAVGHLANNSIVASSSSSSSDNRKLQQNLDFLLGIKFWKMKTWLKNFQNPHLSIDLINMMDDFIS